MIAFLVSTGMVALAEIGDKTQLLALVLAARYGKPIPIIAGILVATLLNHAAAGALGSWITSVLSPNTLRWIVAISFIGMAFWTLIPDQLDDAGTLATRFGIFGTTLIAFFMAEMGDKTQLATVALAAQYDAFFSVVAGTTLGMMLANVPVVFLGHKLADRLPVKLVHRIAAALFLVLGLYVLWTALTPSA